MMKSETDFYRGYFECQRYKMEEQTVPSAGFSPQRDYNVSGDCGGYWQAAAQQQQPYFQQQQNENQPQQQQQPPQNHPVLKKSNSGNGQPLDYLADYFDLSLLGDGFEDRDTATVPSPSWPPLGSMEPVQQLSFYAQSPPDYRAFSPECKPLILEASGNNGGTPSPPPPSAPAPAQNQAAAGNYQNAMNDERNNILIRQCLEDQSFLEKYNIKPMDLPMHELDSTLENVVPNGAPGSVGSANLVDDIEPVFTLAYEQIIGDIQQTCRSLGISTDPMSWSTEEVQSWLGYTLQSFVDTTSADQATKAAITGVSGALRTLWNVTGRQLCSFGEEDFRRRDPLYGDKICANLDLLKLGAVSAPPSCASSPGSSLPDDSSGSASATANSSMDSGFDFVGQILLGGSGPGSYGASSFGSPASSLDSSQSPAPIEVKMEMEELLSVQSIGNPASVETSSSSSPPSSTSSMRHSDDDEEEEEEEQKPAPATTGSGNKKAACGTKNGAHIHLWQFLKELLASGQQHGSCIRWLDKQKGVFKIEDSVRVARLWGIRKNRPAMNYDKLSRSIRQYYRKGIMRKTERSQRLVYQFCHPYGL